VRLKPFFSYYGSKWRLASKYPTPRFDTIVEPFAGSANYSLLHHEKDVILVDASPVVRGVWRYLINVSEDEMRALPDLGDDQSVDELDVSPEARHLIGFWLDRGVDRPAKVWRKWAKVHRHEREHRGSFWGPEARERIAGQLKYIRHWQVRDGGYQDIESMRATWFIDPPYQCAAGRHYPESVIDYQHLGAWARSAEGQVIVCEKLGADWLPFELLLEQNNTRKKSYTEAIYER